MGDLIAHRYRLITKIAVGGMGLVWEASDELLLRRVAVKQLLTQPGLSEHELLVARNRVIREARITARLHHPNAVTLYDVVDQAGYPCLIMQFVPSVSLSALLKQQGPLPAAVVSRIGADVAAALAAAHAVGIVHRDVKPGNVLITEDGTAKLTDFGISHAVGDITLTATGMVSGTPAYLAPEVARGGASGFTADVFSLGSTLYAALEGTPPFGTDSNPMAILHRVSSGRIDPPRHTGPLTPLLLRMLAPEPAARPGMLEVAQTLTGRPPEVQTLQDVPPTAVISAQTVREPRPEQATPDPLVPASPRAAHPAGGTHRPDTVGPGQILAAPTGSGPPPPDVTGRRRSAGAVLAVAAVVMVAVSLIGFLLIQDNNSPQAAVVPTMGAGQPGSPSVAVPAESGTGTPPSESASVSLGLPPSTPAPSLTSGTPTFGALTAGLSAPPSPAAEGPPPVSTLGAASAAELTTPAPGSPVTEQQQAASGSSPTAADLAAAVTDYYALMPAGTDEGWTRLTPGFQSGIARNREYYESFWGRVDRVVATDVTTDTPDRVEATISYYFTDGTVSVERTAYRLVQDGDGLKIDQSEVLSSQPG